MRTQRALGQGYSEDIAGALGRIYLETDSDRVTEASLLAWPPAS